MSDDITEQTARIIAEQAKIAGQTREDAIYLKQLVRANGIAASRAETIDAALPDAVARIRNDIKSVADEALEGIDSKVTTADAIAWHVAKSMLPEPQNTGEVAKAFELVRANPDAAKLARVDLQASSPRLASLIENDLTAAGFQPDKNSLTFHAAESSPLPAATPLAKTPNKSRLPR